MAERTVPTPGQPSEARELTRSDESFVAPAVDIYEDDQGLVLLADLPGVDPSALEVHVDRGVLTIQAGAAHVASGAPISQEFKLTGFYRQFQLPEEIDRGRIQADLKHGVLTLRLPRAPEDEPVRISVRPG